MLESFNEDMILEAVRELTAEYTRLLVRVNKLEGGE